jgi:hypothetical protein
LPTLDSGAQLGILNNSKNSKDANATGVENGSRHRKDRANRHFSQLGGHRMKRAIYQYGLALAGVGAALMLAPSAPAQAAWEPTRPVEFIIPAGTGGGADIMDRTIQGIVSKHNLMKQPILPINKAGGAGGEGFLDVKAAAGNPH